jgi:hypothetical protein
MTRTQNTLGPIIGYHGCDLEIADAVLNRREQLKASSNDYDWLGPGVYFWVDSPQRGFEWALKQSQRNKSKIKNPSVIGAFIYPGLCLNLTDYGARDEVKFAYEAFKAAWTKSGKALDEFPTNKIKEDEVFLQRNLDCAVINVLHQLRKVDGIAPYDSVYGAFEEGGDLFEGSGFREKTHVQLAVCNQNCIVGYFKVPEY